MVKVWSKYVKQIMLKAEFIIFGANNRNETQKYILFSLRPSVTSTMKHLHNDIKRIAEFGAEPKLSQAPDRAPDRILSIGVKDEPQTLIFVLAERHDGRFLPVMVLLAVWLLS